jgi:hypothetical protein
MSVVQKSYWRLLEFSIDQTVTGRVILMLPVGPTKSIDEHPVKTYSGPTVDDKQLNSFLDCLSEWFWMKIEAHLSRLVGITLLGPSYDPLAVEIYSFDPIS